MKNKKKRKSSVKKKSAKSSAPKKKVSRKKAPKSKPARLVVGAMAAVAAIAAAPDDPLGACYWVDTEGQNHCQVTTQSACKALPQSSFRPNKQCPGGS